jgi:polar amino acid transport system permease protein
MARGARHPGALMDWLRDMAAALLNLDILDRYGWRMLEGLGLTIELVALSCSIGFVLGLFIAHARLSRWRLLSAAAYGYTTFFRGTPLLCQLFLVYYGIGQFLPAWREWLTSAGLWSFFRDAFFWVLLTFTLNSAAYQAEALRGAIQSVPRGQVEAAKALGLPAWGILRAIVWPQALIIALRPLGNEVVSMIKASSVASLATLFDLMGATRLAFARSFDLAVYVYAAILYLALVEIIRRIWGMLERRLTRHIKSGHGGKKSAEGAASAAAKL